MWFVEVNISLGLFVTVEMKQKTKQTNTESLRISLNKFVVFTVVTPVSLWVHMDSGSM